MRPIFLLQLASVVIPAVVGFSVQPQRHRPRVVERLQASNGESNNDIESIVGLYRPFADHAWQKLLNTKWFQTDDNVPSELQSNTAPAKGFPEGSMVTMKVQALQPTRPDLVRYARYALLETLVPTSDNNNNSTVGIQVLNLVVFPSDQTNLPVFGADFVALPGNRHLLLLDAQPMEAASQYAQNWKDWHGQHVTDKYAWGGEFPEAVAKYVSQYALWSRLVATEESPKEPIVKIQGDLYHAFQDHLDLYLKLLEEYDNNNDNQQADNWQEPYIQYRLENDPARPMLKSLYGEDWTEQVLQEVLFPQSMKAAKEVEGKAQ